MTIAEFGGLLLDQYQLAQGSDAFSKLIKSQQHSLFFLLIKRFVIKLARVCQVQAFLRRSQTCGNIETHRGVTVILSLGSLKK